MEKISCKRCGQKFESNGVSSLCYDCRRKRTPSIYFGIAAAIVIFGFIIGIIMGETNKAITYVTVLPCPDTPFTFKGV